MSFPSGDLKFDGQIFKFPEGCSSEVRAKWLDENLLSVRIFIQAKAEAECARCLKPVEFNISDSLEYLYYAKGTGIFEDEELLPVEVEYFGRTLDVMPQIFESILTFLPFKILCKEDCKGLCQNCGADLNEGPCSCKNEILDPRLDVLKYYKI